MNPLIFAGCSVFSGMAPALSAGRAGGVPLDEAREISETYVATAAELARMLNFSLDNSKEEAIEARLLAGGNEALASIVDYLRFRCATGDEKDWRHGAKRLVRLIRRFPDADAVGILQTLIATPSASSEYQSLVRDTATVELSQLWD